MTCVTPSSLGWNALVPAAEDVLSEEVVQAVLRLGTAGPPLDRCPVRPQDVTMVAETGWWVLLSYRVPREPSTPRIAVWRRLRQLGVAQLGDGLVALPEDARTRELLEWVAEDITAAGGDAVLWRAQTLAGTDERTVAQAMADARAAEYQTIAAAAEAAATAAPDARLLRRLRRELQTVRRRDHFPPPEREVATQALDRLARSSAAAATRADATTGPS